MAEDARWEELSTRDKLADWADRHQYSLILGGWASSLAFAGAIISRDRYITYILRRSTVGLSLFHLRLQSTAQKVLFTIGNCRVSVNPYL